MIPCIMNTINAINIRLGNNPNIRDKSETKSENKSETKTHMYMMNEYFETCFDNHNRYIESERCELLKENFEDTIECLILEF